MTKFGPNLAFLVILRQVLLAHLVPCWWVGWWLWRGLYLARHLFTLLKYVINYLSSFKAVNSLVRSAFGNVFNISD